MVSLEYLKRSKSEIKKAKKLFNSLSEKNISSLIFHMNNSMLYLVDSIMERHSDIVNDMPLIKHKSRNFFGSDFYETYFLINNLSRKEIKFVGPKNMLITGKKPYQINKKYFKELILEIIKYFNKVYTKVENYGI